MRSVCLLAIASFLAGCATSSGIVPSEHGTYLVSQEHRTIYSTMHTVRVATINEAMAFCDQRDKDFELLAADSVPRAIGQYPAASVRFQCVEKRQILQFGEE